VSQNYVRVVHAAVVLSDQPTVLDQATQGRSVRRHLTARLAPGIALADPTHTAALVRALERQDLAVEVRGEPSAAPPADWSVAECATLLAACAYYRQQVPGAAAPGALTALIARLRAALPLDLRAATIDATTSATQPDDPYDALSADAAAHILALSLAGAPTLTPGAPITFSDFAINEEHAEHGDRIPLRHSQLRRLRELCGFRRHNRRSGADMTPMSDMEPQWAPATAGDSVPRHMDAAWRKILPSIAVVGTHFSDRASVWGARRWPAPTLLLMIWTAVWLVLLAVCRRVRTVASSPVPAIPTPSEPPLAADGPYATERAHDLRERTTAQVDYLDILRHAISRRQALQIAYRTANDQPTSRRIRPLRLEQHGDCWYLQAYCALRQDERTFRVDRIETIVPADGPVRQHGRPGRRTRASRGESCAPRRSRPRRPAPRAGFFPAPPTPPPGSPLVRIWLAE
jgi:hypothetical protein